MNGDLWLLGIMLLFFGIACFILAIAKNKQKFLTRLVYLFFPARKKDLFGGRSDATFRTGDYSIRWEKAKERGRNIIKIAVETERLLPSSVVIMSGNIRQPGRNQNDSIVLELKDLNAINREAGREIFGREEMAGLRSLARECIRFSVAPRRITAWRAYDLASYSMLDAFNRRLTALIASMRKANASDELRLLAGRFVVQRRSETGRRVNALRALVRFHATEKNVIDFLKTVLDDPEFAVAAEAAAGLGMDVERFAFERIARSDTPGALTAISYLTDRPSAAVLEFLFARLTDEPSDAVRAGILEALGRYDDPRVEPALLHALRSGQPELLPAAVKALGARGGRDALEPLYAVSVNRSLPGKLRAAASEAAASVRGRLGETEEGLLSLAGGAGVDGELSLTENRGNDSLERTGNDRCTGGASDE